jgi:predicted HTH domain antitoxin
MALIINDQLFEDLKLTEEQIRIDFACYLYEKKTISTGKARKLAGLDQISFQKELATRNIFIHYSEEDLNKELKNLGINL